MSEEETEYDQEEKITNIMKICRIELKVGGTLGSSHKTKKKSFCTEEHSFDQLYDSSFFILIFVCKLIKMSILVKWCISLYTFEKSRGIKAVFI